MPRSSVVVIALAGCASAGRGAPVGEAPARARWLCEGLGDEACQVRLIAQSLCLQQPDDPECGSLRAAGWLPPPPPPLASLWRCWLVEEVRDDVPASWICLGDRDLAIAGLGVWEVWPHGGWRREDTERRAGWTTTLVDGRTIWLTVVPGGLHVTDGRGQLAAALGPGDGGAAEVEARRAALPTVAEVCAAARACLGAMPVPPRPPDSAEAEIDLGEDPLAGALTLRACHDAWRAAAYQLEVAVGRAAVPAACAAASPAGADAWWIEPRPPFGPP